MNTTPISLTLIIVIFTVIFSIQGFNNQQLKNKFLFRPASIVEFNQWYRFITGGFLHADGWHLGINMFVFYQFGETIEFFLMDQFGGGLGRGLFLLLYFGAIIAGGLIPFFRHKDNQYYTALGASGGVAGILFASAFLNPWEWLWLLFSIPLPYVVFAVLYLFYESYMDKRGGTQIAHDAHIGGAIFGYVCISVMLYILKPELVSFFIDKLMAGPQTLPAMFQ